MRKRYSAEFKAQLVQELLKEDKTINQIAADHEQQINDLYAEIGKLTTQVAWLSRNWRLRQLERVTEPAPCQAW